MKKAQDSIRERIGGGARASFGAGALLSGRQRSVEARICLSGAKLGTDQSVVGDEKSIRFETPEILPTAWRTASVPGSLQGIVEAIRSERILRGTAERPLSKPVYPVGAAMSATNTPNVSMCAATVRFM